ncbi:MAG: Smr/MutS family protein [Paludibacteraceae bacterium]|nr:Smr/MutS family protein [Paludibacteraceae bacterium]
MIYPDTFERKLDFHLLRERLQSLCTSELGRQEVEKMTFLTDYNLILSRLTETQEMLIVLSDTSLGFPEGTIGEVDSALARIRVDGLFLDEAELSALALSMDYACRLSLFFRGLDSQRFPLLSAIRTTTSAVEPIVGWVNALLDRYGQLRDNASAELSRIRREMKMAQGSVEKAIRSVLRQAQREGWLEQDTMPTMREGRMVLPVPPAHRRHIGGIVHDESATGKTLFVEPQEVVEANNHIRSLQSEEQRERVKILTDISRRIRPLLPDIYATNRFLGYVDFLQAKAQLGKMLGAIAPLIENRPLLNWHEARHPVLYLSFQQQNKTVVPLTVQLNDKNRILVISGPNAGGKSVCLKTVALVQYMLQCGLLVPMAESSVCGVFEHILLDIGDEQSLLDDLSTYSSHLRNMKRFLQLADGGTLFLIDEFGSGTEPLIGGAIAEAILMQLNAKEAYGIVTTHYTNLKHLAQTTEGLLNAAMLYDRGAMRPLFQLSVGQAGSSFAIEIARQIGLNEEIIAQATELVGEEHINYDHSLQDIARDKRYWAKKRDNIRQKEKHLEERIARYEEELAQIKEKRKTILLQAKEEAADLLQRSNAVIERTIREIKEHKADSAKTKQAREKVEEMKQQVSPAERPKRLRDLKDLRFLTKTAPAPQSNIANTIHQRKVSFNRTLDLRGMRADEALEALIAYMDDAIMVAAGEVTILHGTGTGALKQITRDYLSSLNRRGQRIESFHDGDPNHGGAGVTIVEI